MNINILAGFGIFFLPLIVLTIIILEMRKNARWPEEKRKLTDIVFILFSILGVGLIGLVLYMIDFC